MRLFHDQIPAISIKSCRWIFQFAPNFYFPRNVTYRNEQNNRNRANICICLCVSTQLYIFSFAKSFEYSHKYHRVDNNQWLWCCFCVHEECQATHTFDRLSCWDFSLQYLILLNLFSGMDPYLYLLHSFFIRMKWWDVCLSHEWFRIVDTTTCYILNVFKLYAARFSLVYVLFTLIKLDVDV